MNEFDELKLGNERLINGELNETLKIWNLIIRKHYNLIN